MKLFYLWIKIILLIKDMVQKKNLNKKNLNLKLNLPFLDSVKNKKGNHQGGFVIKNQKDLIGSSFISDILEKVIDMSKTKSNLNSHYNSMNNSTKMKYMKGSDSKKYYENIKNNQKSKKGGGIENVLFPAGLSVGMATLGLAAMKHASDNNSKKSKK